MADDILRRVNELVDSLGELSPEQQVHAATARRIAAVMEGDEAPLYALAGLARELRNAIAALSGDPVPVEPVALSDDDLDRLLRGA
ncbi:hypothetical protein [Verrucosispora sp. WMMD1129]|uniref:hypothetical protein n=1 Tax=Verrucosispora sp. WMMD1129 TaxID=3016093 RepID=UPI00249BE85A|nr:hypothetical protein [Verrucosispora sp. WMMD1129]WFE44274.1 hypothetical protein O7624_07960 [Verrucosispora sp. WMMD1129]